MDLEKFTERARGFLQAAQTIAMRESHQKLAPEHLLKALLDDEEGLAVDASYSYIYIQTLVSLSPCLKIISLFPLEAQSLGSSCFRPHSSFFLK